MDSRKISGIIKKSNRYRYLFIFALAVTVFYIFTEVPEAGCASGSFEIISGAVLWIFAVSWTYSEQWLTVSSTVSKKGAVYRGVRLGRIAQVHGFDFDEYFSRIAKHQIPWVVLLMILSTLSCILNYEFGINRVFEEKVMVYTAVVIFIPLVSYGTLYFKKMLCQSSACRMKESSLYDIISFLVNLLIIISFIIFTGLIFLSLAFMDFDKLAADRDDSLDFIAAKPVIYIYPEESMDVSVKVNINETGHLTYTYPQHNEKTGWNVTAEPGSVLFDEEGREYSYLFWEGVSEQDWDMESGFVVKGSDTVPFLQEKLEYLGLTPKEYNEFIVYWMPKMQDNEYNLISFQTEKYEEYAALEITPQPDSIQRVFMAYEPLDMYIEIPEQQLQSFERHGYTVIEWGGVEIK